MGALHLAAMPFPSVQGTQAALRAMLDAEHDAGRDPALLTYAHGAFELSVPWRLHRIANLTKDRSLRSGPSARKLVADVQLALRLRGVIAEEEPTVVVAHHVEAAMAALTTRSRPVVFFAHTALGPELPGYLPPRLTRWARHAGEALDVTLARRADVTLAVSPSLARALASASGVEVAAIPLPWTPARATESEERRRARARFELPPISPVFLYAGNLDAYQGLEILVEAFARVRAKRPEARLLVATESETDALRAMLWSAGAAEGLLVAPLADEPDRRAAHAAADLALVVRGQPAGLPIKLLDAMARGVAVVATRRASAGLDLEESALVVNDDDAEALAAAALLLVEDRESTAERGRRGRRYIEEAHTPERYLAAMDDALAHLIR